MSALLESESKCSIPQNKKRLFREILQDLIDDSHVIIEKSDKQCGQILGEKCE